MKSPPLMYEYDLWIEMYAIWYVTKNIAKFVRGL